MRKYTKILTIVLGISLTFQMKSSVFASELSTVNLDNSIEVSKENEEDLEIEAYIEEASEVFEEVAKQNVIMALVYLCDFYDMKCLPQMDAETVIQLPTGTTVQVIGMEVDEDYNIWYQVKALKGEGAVIGYIDRTHLAYSHESLLTWEDSYFPKMETFSLRAGYADVEQFPESYQAKLNSLKDAHPNWIFVKQNTGLNWDTVIANENYEDRNLVYKTLGDAYKNGLHSPGWYYASKEAVEYYMDPRNFLNETRIFQYEQLTFNSSYHSLTAVQNVLNGTFMKGMIPEEDMTYASAFYLIGASLKVSPFHLACRVYQEQGTGTSDLISGTYPDYEGYYNYYNIGASGTTTKQIVTSGLQKAIEQGWDTRYASLRGGALIVSKNYIMKGQDTLYLQKFDVEGPSLYTHQYMQNISAPYTEAQMIRNAYKSTGALDNPFVFKIPVYNKMPSIACPVPGTMATPTPTEKPVATPTGRPTATPTEKPVATPTGRPTSAPTEKPTAVPTEKPTVVPTEKPTAAPTEKPTVVPTEKPTSTPTKKPTAEPTEKPTAVPTEKPTAVPTEKPTAVPTKKPTIVPTEKPAVVPSEQPTAIPVEESTKLPAIVPTETPAEAQLINVKEDNKEIMSNEQQMLVTQTKPTEIPSITQGTTSSGVIVVAVTPKPQTASADKPVVYMDMKKSTMLYSETLEQMKEQNMEVVFTISDIVTWTLDSSTIATTELDDVNLQVTVGESSIPKEVLMPLEGETFVELSLAHDGEFGFTAEMTVEIEKAKPGQYAHLFYYNEETQTFEFICTAVVDKANKAAFEFSHASDYVIVVSSEARETLTAQKNEELEDVEEIVEISLVLPEEVKKENKPGKIIEIILIILSACIIGVIGTFVLLRKK